MKRRTPDQRCPHQDWEPTCGCTHCDATRWPRLLTRSHWKVDTCLMLMEMAPECRLSWIGMNLFFTLWKVQARVPGECNPPPPRDTADQVTNEAPRIESTMEASEPRRDSLTADQISDTPTATLLERLGRTKSRARPDGHCMYSALAAQSGGRMTD